VVAVTVETHPDIEGAADGTRDVGDCEGLTLGSIVGAAVRKVTLLEISNASSCCCIDWVTASAATLASDTLDASTITSTVATMSFDTSIDSIRIISLTSIREMNSGSETAVIASATISISSLVMTYVKMPVSLSNETSKLDG
jgi:hypothetical protein